MLLALRSRYYFIRSLAYNERPDPCVPTKTLDCAPYKYRRTDRSSTQAMARLHSFGSVLEAGHNASSLGLKRKEKKRKEKHTTAWDPLTIPSARMGRKTRTTHDSRTYAASANRTPVRHRCHHDLQSQRDPWEKKDGTSPGALRLFSFFLFHSTVTSIFP